MTLETAGTSAPLEDLTAIVGAEHVRAAGEHDAIDGVVPYFVVEPGSVDEVSRVMAMASRAGFAVAPRGAGTQMGIGNSPRRLDLAVCMTCLNRIIEYAPGDLVVAAQAGLSLSALQRALVEHGQMLALDPYVDSTATLGGIVATNASGPYRLRYGAVRDLIIGITIVLADGTVAKAGGKVVKNVAGYDLGKLFTGSLGTLGIIVETIFRLHPRPAARRLVTLPLESYEDAAAAVQAVLHSTLVPSALEVVVQRSTFNVQRSSDGIERHAGDPYSPSPLVGEGAGGRGAAASVHLFALFEGIEPGVVAQADAAVALLQPFGHTHIIKGAEAHDRWERVRGAVHVRANDPDRWLLKINHVIAALPDVLQHVHEVAGEGVWSAASHAGSGITMVALTLEPEAAIRAVEELRTRVVPAGCSVVALAAPPAAKRHVDVWGAAGDALPLFERVKARFDPDHLLNPGRFVGGI